MTKFIMKKNNILNYYAVFVLWLYAGLSELIKLTLINSKIQIIILLTVICIFCAINMQHLKKLNNIYTVFLILMFIIVWNKNATGFVAILTYSVVFLLCMSSVYNHKWMDPMIKILYLSYIVYAFFTILFLFMPLFYVNHIAPLFPDTSNRLIAWYNIGCISGLANHYSTNAMFICTGLMISVATLIENRNKKQLILILMFIVALLLTGKRGPLIFAVTTIFVLYYFSIPKEKNISRFIKTLGFILVMGCVFVIVVSTVPALSSTLERFQTTLDSGDVSMGRYMLWNLAFKSFREHPFLGIGWGNFYQNVSIAYNGVTKYHVHNVYIQLLCETGIVGFTIYITWFIALLRLAIKSYKECETHTHQRCMLGFSLAFQVYFLLYNFTGNNLYEEELYVPYFVACAIAIAYRVVAMRTNSLGKDISNE